MRVVVVVGIIALLAACDEQRGARVIVEGPVKFDHVELFFGKGGSRAVPITPSRAMDPAARQQDGQRYNRVAAPGDVVAANDMVTRLDLLLAPGDETAEYVGIVAYVGATPVGIGEVTALAISDDKLLQYVVTLAPFATEQAEVWGEGGGPKCLYWSKAGRDPIAVVRGGDPDCDALKGSVDCSPNAYCPVGNQACVRPVAGDGSCTFLDANRNCIVGHCSEGMGCSAELCGTPGVCDPACETETTLPDRLACASEVDPAIHTEVTVPISQETRGACFSAVHVPVPLAGVQCIGAKIEAPLEGLFAEIDVSVDSLSSGEACKLFVSPIGNVPFEQPAHVYISIAANGTVVPDSLTQRWTFVVGISPDSNAIECSSGTRVPTVTTQGEVAVCPMAP